MFAYVCGRGNEVAAEIWRRQTADCQDESWSQVSAILIDTKSLTELFNCESDKTKPNLISQ